MQFERKKRIALLVGIVVIVCAVGLGSSFEQTSESSVASPQKQKSGVHSSQNPSKTAPRVAPETTGNRDNQPEPQHPSFENQQPSLNITNPAPVAIPWVLHDKLLWLANLILALVGIGGVIAAICTLGVLRRQTKANWVAAKASLRQTNYMMTSERAWFVCRADLRWEREGLERVVAHISFTYENIGKTPGFITEIGFAVNGLRKEQKLPEIPLDYGSEDKTEWKDGRGLPILPGDNMGRRADWPATQLQLEEWKRGELIIWVHGYVKYRDCFIERERETRYCLRLNSNTDGGNAVPFFIDGPPAYNSAT